MSKAEKKANDTKQSPEEIQKEISEELKKQAEAAAPKDASAELQAKLDEMKDSLLRTMADAENTRKRAAKEVEDANRYGISSLAKDLIPILENLQRAVDSAPQAETEVIKNFIEGVDLTRKELLNIFERRAIKRIEPKPGEKFDHNYHQAVAQVEDHKYEPGAVIQVVQSGYIIHDRLLRPAMVTVSKGAPQQPKVDTTA